jgi:DedD protein
MEVRVRERLIGALVLVAIVVLVVPAILKGRGSGPPESPSEATRQIEMPTSAVPTPPVESVLVPEPVADATPTPPAPKRAQQAPLPPEPGPDRRTGRDAGESLSAAKPQAAAEVPAKPQSATPASASATTAWAVQLGAFSNRDKAEQLVAQLKERRYAAFVLEYRASGQVLYRVRVGPEQDRARAEEIAARLAKDGFQPVVARHP